MEHGTGPGPDRGVPEAGPRERAERGRAARKVAPRSAHADYAPAPGRPDPVDVVEEQSRTRLPELVPVRYGRMTESPFRFYRGAAAIMAQDLSGTPRSGLRAQLCGDAHMLNFRLLASPERRLVFDINDFDETLPGPWEWDVKRLSASLVIAARANGFDDAERAFIVRAAVRSYREGMRRLAGMGHLEVWYSSAEFGQLGNLLSSKVRKGERQRLTKAAATARGHDNLQAFDKLTAEVDGERRIVPDPPLIVPLGDLLPGVEQSTLELGIRDLIDRYSRSLQSDRRHLVALYRVVDMARKVVGVGSVGTRCWIVLLLGRDDEDPLILQAKEADRSVLAAYVGESAHSNQGERVVSGQRLMQATSDIFLGWQRVHGIDRRQRDFYVRQLRDWKGVAQPELMEPDTMRAFGEVCGATLARAHARSGDRIAIAAYLGRGDRFDRALAVFAESYADQNERDHAALRKRCAPAAFPRRACERCRAARDRPPGAGRPEMPEDRTRGNLKPKAAPKALGRWCGRESTKEPHMATHAGQPPRQYQQRSGAVAGWTLTAAVLLIVGGFMAIFEGIAGIAKDDVFVSTANYTYEFSVAGWGWVHLFLGIAVVLAGFALMTGALWARVVGVIMAGLSMISHFMFLPYAPVWSIVVIAVDAFIIWALCAPRTAVED